MHAKANTGGQQQNNEQNGKSEVKTNIHTVERIVFSIHSDCSG